MGFEVAAIKEDVFALDTHTFFEKYFLSNEVWYIDEYMKGLFPAGGVSVDSFKEIFHRNLGLSTENVFISGSAKFGFSLSKKPIEDRAGYREEFFLPFNIDSDSRPVSDIDIAIVSQTWFDIFWRLYRTSYSASLENTYKHIIRETYRGFINEKNVEKVPKCRVVWNKDMLNTIRDIRMKMRFQHEMTIRVYRTMEDYEDYSESTIRTLRREVR